MRLFIAFNFSNQVKTYLKSVQDYLKHHTLSGKFTSFNNFHLTLRFLGEYPESKVKLFCDILDNVKEQKEPFFIKLGKLDSFVRENKHIVYMDILDKDKRLLDLANSLNLLVNEKLNCTNQERFKAHITLAREVILNTRLNDIKIKPYPEKILVKDISLMLSHRSINNELIYTPLYSVELMA
ncbi:MAG TPA: RNA 2',3'-cyclic phosphodiesterase [Haloplasmataceae bacterium]